MTSRHGRPHGEKGTTGRNKVCCQKSAPAGLFPRMVDGDHREALCSLRTSRQRTARFAGLRGADMVCRKNVAGTAAGCLPGGAVGAVGGSLPHKAALWYPANRGSTETWTFQPTNEGVNASGLHIVSRYHDKVTVYGRRRRAALSSENDSIRTEPSALCLSSDGRERVAFQLASHRGKFLLLENLINANR